MVEASFHVDVLVLLLIVPEADCAFSNGENCVGIETRQNELQAFWVETMLVVNEDTTYPFAVDREVEICFQDLVIR